MTKLKILLCIIIMILPYQFGNSQMAYYNEIDYESLNLTESICLPSHTTNYNYAWTTIAINLATTALDAFGDAAYDEGHKILGKALNATGIGIFVISPFINDWDKSQWGWYLASHVFIRASTFNIFYNSARGLPLTYTGTTSVYDNMFANAPPNFIWFSSAAFAIVGFNIPFNIEKNKP